MMDFKKVDKKYRPIPFWSWNEKLETEETAEQVRRMNDVGMGGFFMHARGGLQTEYMGEEWFDNIGAATDEAINCGMRPWAYDENGWPSGFGSGVVNGKGVEYQQKYLRMESEKEHTDTYICKSGEHYFYYDINPFYVDTLDKKVIAEFIKTTYEPYYERYGNKVEGFFTDEPQISRAGIPWSFVFEEEYKARYNDDLLNHLEELFLSIGEYKKTRIRFWKMVTDLFSEAYMKQIYDWCEEKGMKLTGHLVLEENFESQLTSNAACMPHYEYMHIPGMDWLGRNIYDCLTARQVSSVAEQMGQDSVLSETFAMCGHNVSLAELKGIYEWQMVRGINLLCPHLEGYSLRGIRKRDYPPAMYFQQPWWSEYDKLIDAVSREGMLLTEGEKKADILVIHPQTSAWALFDCGKNEGLGEINEAFKQVICELERKHAVFHLGDETIMQRHAKVENGEIIIGKQRYSRVITSVCTELLPSTEALLEEYKASGGKVVDVADIEDNNVIEDESITYAIRYFDGFKVHYFVNSSAQRKNVKVNVNGKRLDAYTGDLYDFCGEHCFEPWGSLMIIEDGSKNIANCDIEANLIYPKGKFKLSDKVINALTLDKCDYYFDGELQEKNGYVLNISQRANALERAVKIHQDYHVKVNEVPNELYLVCETPDIFKITVNGIEIEKNICGYYIDKSQKKIDIQKYIKQGENIISFDCDFVQSPEVYENIKKSDIFESEKNKLAYDMEIEAIYLIGDFGVETDGEWTTLERNAKRYSGEFAIGKQAEEIIPTDIQMQGFPFFCGEMTVEGEIDINGENPYIAFNIKGINAIRVEIGDFKAVLLTDNRISLKGTGLSGKQKIKLTLINNLRNIHGPHHLKEGESYQVGPNSFFKEPCVWNKAPEEKWDDDYCFVDMGIL